MIQYFKLLVFCLLFSSASFGQEIRVGEKVVHQKSKPQGLTYHAQLPGSNSYAIVKNTKNVSLTEEQLMEMNKHRKYDESVEWKINSDLVVLLKPFEK